MICRDIYSKGVPMIVVIGQSIKLVLREKRGKESIQPVVEES